MAIAGLSEQKNACFRFQFQKGIFQIQEEICSLIFIKKMLIICAIVGFVIVLVIVIVAAVIATLPDQVIISEGN